MTTAIEEKVPTPAVESEGTMTQETLDEIDAGVEKVVEEMEEAKNVEPEGDDKVLPPKDDLPPPEEKEGDGEEEIPLEIKGEKSGSDDDLSGTITDDHLERAVKAGMPMATARTFKDAKALDSVIALLKPEEKSGGDTSSEEIDPLSGLPELDPDVYDEKIIAVVDILKKVVGSQSETIKGLKSEGVAREGSWFDGKVESFGKELADALSEAPAKLTELKDTFNALKTGYKAVGKDVSQDVVLKEAVKVVLGDVVAKAEATVKAGKLASRKGQHSARPGGTNAVKTTDAFEDTAKELDEKFDFKI